MKEADKKVDITIRIQQGCYSKLQNGIHTKICLNYRAKVSQYTYSRFINDSSKSLIKDNKQQ